MTPGQPLLPVQCSPSLLPGRPGQSPGLCCPAAAVLAAERDRTWQDDDGDIRRATRSELTSENSPRVEIIVYELCCVE